MTAIEEPVGKETDILTTTCESIEQILWSDKCEIFDEFIKEKSTSIQTDLTKFGEEWKSIIRKHLDEFKNLSQDFKLKPNQFKGNQIEFKEEQLENLLGGISKNQDYNLKCDLLSKVKLEIELLEKECTELNDQTILDYKEIDSLAEAITSNAKESQH